MIDRVLLEARYADDPLAMALIEYTCALERQYEVALKDFREADSAVEEWRRRSIGQDREVAALRDQLEGARRELRGIKGAYSSRSEYAAEKQLQELADTMTRLQQFDFKVNKKAAAPFGKKTP